MSVQQWVEAARVSDIPPGKCRTVQVGNQTVVLIQVNGEFYALDNCCPHNGGPIGRGEVVGDTVICPYHRWEFDVRTGKAKVITGYRIRTYPVKQEGDVLYVAL